jgi:TolB-like protein
MNKRLLPWIRKHLPKLKLVTVGVGAMALSACATDVLHASRPPAITDTAALAVLPFANYTTTPGAGERASSITASLLIAHHMTDVMTVRPLKGDGLPLGQLPHNRTNLKQAARKGAHYALDGSVEEWRYTIGLDGEPAVAVTLNLVDVQTGKTVWSATASRSGNPRESVGVLAEETINAMLSRLLT